MQRKILLLSLAIAASATLVSAQTISGTLNCAKADPMHSIDVGDEPGHSFNLVKVQCTWSKPVEMAGAKAKDGYSVASSEARGGKTAEAGAHVGTMESGDKYLVRFQGTGTVSADHSGSASGTWTFTGGSGKMKGLTGKGTYKTTSLADGTSTSEIEGEYKTAQ